MDPIATTLTRSSTSGRARSWAPIQAFGLRCKAVAFLSGRPSGVPGVGAGVALGHIEATNPGPRESMNGTARNLPIFKLLRACGDTTGNRSKSPGRASAYADHVGESVLLAWNGSSFAPLQSFSGKGGRCFRYFTADGEHYLAFANIQGDSTLYRWGGKEFSLPETEARRQRVLRRADKIKPVCAAGQFHSRRAPAPRTNLMSRTSNGPTADLCWSRNS